MLAGLGSELKDIKQRHHKLLVKVYLVLGSNHQPRVHLNQALELLAQNYTIESKSPIFQTPPVGKLVFDCSTHEAEWLDTVACAYNSKLIEIRQSQAVYWNLGVCLQVQDLCSEVLINLKSIEKALRRAPHDPDQCSIDIDYITAEHQAQVYTYAADAQAIELHHLWCLKALQPRLLFCPGYTIDLEAFWAHEQLKTIAQSFIQIQE